ncbi:hypothetical protein D9M72_243840 [compost metagenome]
MQAPAQGQHRHVDIGPPLRLHLHAHGGIAAMQLDHPRLVDALALHRYQRGGMAERHAHLEHRGVARRIGLLLRQQVDAVMVLAAEPELALARDPDCRRRLRGAPVLVARACHQFDLAGLLKRHVAARTALRIGAGLAHGAEVARLGAVVIAVEAAHHALARRGGDACPRVDLDRRIRHRLAVDVQHHAVHGQLLLDRDPAIGADAGHHRRRPHRHGLAQRLDLAVGVGKAGFEQQVARGFNLGQLAQRHGAVAVLVERHRQLVGDQLLAVGTGIALLVLIHLLVAAGAFALGTRRIERELVIAREADVFVAQQRGHAHGQPGRAAAGQVVDLHADRQFGRRDHGPRLASHLQRAGQHRQAECLDAETAAGVAARAAIVLRAIALLRFQLHAVDPQLGRRRHLEGALRAAPAGRGLAPLQRQLVGLAAAFMADHHARGQRAAGWRQGKALRGLGTDQVLHRHGLAGAQQRAVEDGVGAHRGCGAGVGRHIEAPGLDATVPV